MFKLFVEPPPAALPPFPTSHSFRSSFHRLRGAGDAVFAAGFRRLRGGGDAISDLVVGGGEGDSRWPLGAGSPLSRGEPERTLRLNISGWAPLLDTTTMVNATNKPGSRFGVSAAPVSVTARYEDSEGGLDEEYIGEVWKSHGGEGEGGESGGRARLGRPRA